MSEDINVILEEARSSLSSFCMNECKSECCRKGKLLLLKKAERELIVGDEKKQDIAIKKGFLEKQDSKNYHFDFEKQGPCRHLSSKTGACNVYENVNRPTICSDYPLFKTGDYIISAGNCRGVVEGKLDKFLEKMKKLGFKVM